MNGLLTFFAAYVLSVIGSIPPGIISITAAMTTLRKSLMAGLLVGLGAVLVEWFQAFVCVRFSFWCTVYPQFEVYLHYIAFGVFLLLGIYFLKYAPTEPRKPNSNTKGASDLLKGISVSLANVMVFPYWIFYSTYLGTKGWLGEGWTQTILFCTGVALGSFTVFWLYALLAEKVLSRIENIQKIANRMVGVIFILLTVLQFCQML
ncbi:MAG: hypothetical protein R2769_06225 [Saprospiraceae bacterium]